jgi:hypothetical protein
MMASTRVSPKMTDLQRDAGGRSSKFHDEGNNIPLAMGLIAAVE